VTRSLFVDGFGALGIAGSCVAAKSGPIILSCMTSKTQLYAGPVFHAAAPASISCVQLSDCALFFFAGTFGDRLSFSAREREFLCQFLCQNFSLNCR
jgi:hypothetical protein